MLISPSTPCFLVLGTLFLQNFFGHGKSARPKASSRAALADQSSVVLRVERPPNWWPEPPQNPACGFPAPGSSKIASHQHSTPLHCRVRQTKLWPGKRKLVYNPVELGLGHIALCTSAAKHLAPIYLCFFIDLGQGRVVPSKSIVIVMPVQHLVNASGLFFYGPVSYPPHFLLQFRDAPFES